MLRVKGSSVLRMKSSFPAHRAGQHAALPVHHLGRRIGDDVGAELHRPLQHRRGEGIVDHGGDAVLLARCRRSPAMSTMSSVGLAGVSKKKTLVSGRIAASHAAVSRPSTIVVAMPNLGSSVSVSQRHDPNAARAPTRWSPAESWHSSAAVIAAMPGRHAARRLGAFQQRDALLEHLHGGVLQARIGHAPPARRRSARRRPPRNHRHSPTSGRSPRTSRRIPIAPCRRAPPALPVASAW